MKEIALNDTDVKTYLLNHTMIRVRNPDKSVKFYQSLGMTLLETRHFPELKFDLYFLGFNSQHAAAARKVTSNRQGMIELTHNYGTELDPTFRYSNGNEKPHLGFSHTCISVDNVAAACRRLKLAGNIFHEASDAAAGLSDAPILLDPDKYWIQLVQQQHAGQKPNRTLETDVGTYRMNHTMLRIKDPKLSLDFYQNVLGMTLLQTHEDSSRAYTRYILGYKAELGAAAGGPTQNLEGLLELRWAHGSDKDAQLRYHDGNSEPKGFGHIAISVDILKAACQRFEKLECRWQKRLSDGQMKDIAFILDPDGYWIELIQNEQLGEHVLKSAMRGLRDGYGAMVVPIFV